MTVHDQAQVSMARPTHAHVDPFAWVERITQKLIGSSSLRWVSRPTKKNSIQDANTSWAVIFFRHSPSWLAKYY